MSQFLVNPADVDSALGRAKLTGGEAHHLARVSRARAGEKVRLFDGCGRRWEGVVREHGKEFSLIDSLVALPANEPPFEVTLAQALIKGERWEWLLEKAVELGVARIVPLLSERTEAVPGRGGEKIERWKKIVLAAAKQSERGRIPEIGKPVSVGDCLGMLGQREPGEARWVLAERSGLASPLRARGPVFIAVGPEGGWTEGEIARFVEAGFAPAGLGPTVLRSETAAVAALTLTLIGG